MFFTQAAPTEPTPHTARCRTAPWPASLLRGAASERSCAGPTPACLPRPSCPSVRGADVIRARRGTHHPPGRLNLHPEGAGDSTSRSCRAAGRRVPRRAAAVGDLTGMCAVRPNPMLCAMPYLYRRPQFLTVCVCTVLQQMTPKSRFIGTRSQCSLSLLTSLVSHRCPLWRNTPHYLNFFLTRSIDSSVMMQLGC